MYQFVVTVEPLVPANSLKRPPFFIGQGRWYIHSVLFNLFITASSPQRQRPLHCVPTTTRTCSQRTLEQPLTALFHEMENELSGV